jgi:hypothetical protein
MPSVPQDYGRMGHFHDTYAGNEHLAPLVEKSAGRTTSSSWRSAKINALRESTKPIGVASYRVVSTLPE